MHELHYLAAGLSVSSLKQCCLQDPVHGLVRAQDSWPAALQRRQQAPSQQPTPTSHRTAQPLASHQAGPARMMMHTSSQSVHSSALVTATASSTCRACSSSSSSSSSLQAPSRPSVAAAAAALTPACVPALSAPLRRLQQCQSSMPVEAVGSWTLQPGLTLQTGRLVGTRNPRTAAPPQALPSPARYACSAR